MSNEVGKANFFDLTQLDSLRKSAQKDEKGSLTEVARQFESLFVKTWLKTMRDANEVFEAGEPFNSNNTRFYQDMADDQMALELSSSGALGLADLMVKQLQPDASNYRPASVLSSDPFSQRQSRNLPAGAVPPAHIPQVAADQGLELTQRPRRQTVAAGEQSRTTATAKAASTSRAATSSAALDGTPAAFVNAMRPHAERIARQLNVPAAVLIAQAALETGWGQKVLADGKGGSSHNLFNIKADQRWQGDRTQVTALEFEQGVAVKRRSAFRVYDSFAQSFDDFKSFVENSTRYADALRQSADPAKFLQGLQQAGYATDPLYAKKILAVLDRVSAHLNTEASPK